MPRPGLRLSCRRCDAHTRWQVSSLRCSARAGPQSPGSRKEPTRRQAEAGGYSTGGSPGVHHSRCEDRGGEAGNNILGPGQLTLEKSTQESGLHCRCEAWGTASTSRVLRQGGHWAQDVALRSQHVDGAKHTLLTGHAVGAKKPKVQNIGTKKSPLPLPRPSGALY